MRDITYQTFIGKDNHEVRKKYSIVYTFMW